MVISAPTCRLHWKRAGRAGWESLPRAVCVLSPSGTYMTCETWPRWIHRRVSLPVPVDCAQLALLGTLLSCSPLIYYKGDGDKWPREPLGIQCPRQVRSVVTSLWPCHSQLEMEFLQGLLGSGGCWGVFLELPICWRGHSVRMRPQAPGNVSLLASWVHITGSCCLPGDRAGICGLALAL